uniref:Murine leukemia virus integrase C-terminal domain-containing protein n=1 Tax=Labrus bergylta TaxID=56723 RepID=A0A3Q3EGA1_9LABR
MQSQHQPNQLPPQPLDEQKTNAVQPGDKVFVKVFRRKWFNERCKGPFEVVRSTGTAVQVKGSPTWYHLSHCVKALDQNVTRTRVEVIWESQFSSHVSVQRKIMGKENSESSGR